MIYFKSFSDMASSLNSKDIGFENCSKDEILNLYYSFYPKEDESKYGVVAIKIKTT